MKIYIVGDVNSSMVREVTNLILHSGGRVELYVYTSSCLRYMEVLREALLNNISAGIVVYERKLKDIVADVDGEVSKDTVILIGDNVPPEIAKTLQKVNARLVRCYSNG